MNLAMDKQSVEEGHLPKAVLLIPQAGGKNKTGRQTSAIMNTARPD
jgi:hypothetical protein